MKTTIRIGKMELRMLFYSPIAWLLMVIFTVQIGLDFMSHFTDALMVQREGTDNYPLSMVLFSNKYGGTFLQIIKSLYLYVPLMTMGLISRELSSGSIKLL